MYNLAKVILLKLITLYQVSISPDHSWVKYKYPHGYCRYYPTCSQYMYEAIDLHGSFRGIGKGFRRLCRCHPWAKGGYDPLSHT